MNKLAVLILAALVASCNSSQTSLHQTRDNPDFAMEVVLVPQDRITEKCTSLGVQYEANGCAAFYPDIKKCVIYVMPQRYMYDQERLAIIGHEVWHCRYGQWHD